MQLQIVNADHSHSKAIWEWRNDPVTRSMFKSQDFVLWEDHSSWYQKSLINPERIMYVGLNGQLPFGIVRFYSIYTLENSFEISININPLDRGKGLGLKILKLALSKLKEERPSVKKIIAKVKQENPASKRLFKSADFVAQQSNETEFNSYFFVYNS